MMKVVKLIPITVILTVVITQKEPFWLRILPMCFIFIGLELLIRAIRRFDIVANHSGIVISTILFFQISAVNLSFPKYRLNEAFLIQMVGSLVFNTCVTTNWKLACITQAILQIILYFRLKGKYGELPDTYFIGSTLAFIFFAFGSYCYSNTLKQEFLARFEYKKASESHKGVLNSLSEGVCIVNPRTDHFEFLNPKIKDTFNIESYCPDKIMGEVLKKAQIDINKELDEIIYNFKMNKASLDQESPDEFLNNLLKTFIVHKKSTKYDNDDFRDFSLNSEDNKAPEDLQFQNLKTPLNLFLSKERKSILQSNYQSKETKISIQYKPKNREDFENDLEFTSKEFIIKTKFFEIGKPSNRDPLCIHMFIETTQISQLEAQKAQNHYQRQMLANVSHEFRTPLNSIMTSLSLMENENKLKNKKDKFLKIALSSSNILGFLVEDILDHAKIESGVFKINYQEFTINELLGEIEDIFILQAKGKRLGIYINVEDELRNLPIISDKQRLKQILMNLVSNALKFTDKGSITIQITEGDLGGLERKEEGKREIGWQTDYDISNTSCVLDFETNEENIKDCEQYSFRTNKSKFFESFPNVRTFQNLRILQTEENTENKENEKIEERKQLREKCQIKNLSKFSKSPNPNSQNEIMINMSVIDTGIGIAKKDQKSLFKLFGKLSSNHNRNKTGCGLGLTICKKIIERLDGSISLESEEGKGTTVKCLFKCKY